MKTNKNDKIMREALSRIDGWARHPDNKDVVFRDQKGQFSEAFWGKAGRSQFIATIGKKESGGLGLSFSDMNEIFRYAGEVINDGGCLFSLCAHTLAGVAPLQKFAKHPGQINKLKMFFRGDLKLASAMTEAETGSDVFKLRTTAKLKGKSYFIDGSKAYVTNGPVADDMILYAVTDPSKGYFGGITAFLVSARARGVSKSSRYLGVGLRTSPICDFRFQNLKVGLDSVIGEVGAGAQIFQYAMICERLGLASASVGRMKKVIETIKKPVNQPKRFRKSLREHQAVTHQIAEMIVMMETARAVTDEGYRKLAQGREAFQYSSIVKLAVSEALQSVCQKAVQILGAQGFLVPNDVERFLRDSLGATIYSGTSEIHKNIIFDSY